MAQVVTSLSAMSDFLPSRLKNGTNHTGINDTNCPNVFDIAKLQNRRVEIPCVWGSKFVPVPALRG